MKKYFEQIVDFLNNCNDAYTVKKIVLKELKALYNQDMKTFVEQREEIISIISKTEENLDVYGKPVAPIQKILDEMAKKRHEPEIKKVLSDIDDIESVYSVNWSFEPIFMTQNGTKHFGPKGIEVFFPAAFSKRIQIKNKNILYKFLKKMKNMVSGHTNYGSKADYYKTICQEICTTTKTCCDYNDFMDWYRSCPFNSRERFEVAHETIPVLKKAIEKELKKQTNDLWYNRIGVIVKNFNVLLQHLSLEEIKDLRNWLFRYNLPTDIVTSEMLHRMKKTNKATLQVNSQRTK